MIPLRWKIWGLTAIAVALWLLRWRSKAVGDALRAVERERAEQRADTARKAKEIEDDVGSLPGSRLADRARRWVREN